MDSDRHLARLFVAAEQPYGFQAVGQQRFGLTLLPPMPVTEMMTRWLIPKYRNNRQNLRVVDVQPLLHLAQMLNALELQTTQTEGASARIEYLENGYRIEPPTKIQTASRAIIITMMGNTTGPGPMGRVTSFLATTPVMTQTLAQTAPEVWRKRSGKHAGAGAQP